MRDHIEQRRDELAGELTSGQKMLAELDAQRIELEQTLLRISGALQVLTELLDAADHQATPRAEPALARAVAAVG